jgi:branched-chain amino acid transport system ATP-binding protein
LDLLAVEGLRAGYKGLNVLWDVDLNVKKNTIVSVIGSNGSGKTTLLNAIMGFVEVNKGEIIFNGNKITHLKPQERVGLGIAYVPSERELFPEMTVEDNLMLGAYTPRARKHLRESLSQVYEFFPILSERRNQLAGTMSGGEQQMLAIGRALMSRPELLILDELSTGLAPAITLRIYRKLEGLSERMTVLLAEQNIHQAFMVSDYIYVMENGKIIASGSPDELSESSLIKSAYLGVKG